MSELLFGENGQALSSAQSDTVAASGNGAASHQDIIIDGSEADFAQTVIEASMNHPIIVDFWAPWCGPCKQLTPALENAVKAASGKVKLVKIDIDQNPGLAQQLQIQSVPTVYAFAGGRPVDGFQGALPPSQLQQFVAKLVEIAGQLGGGSDDQSKALDAALEQADQAASDGDHATAAALYGQVLDHRPDDPVLFAKLAVAYAKMGEADAAREILANLPPDAEKLPDVARLMATVNAALDLSEKAGEAAGQVDALSGKVETDPNDHGARLELAEAQAALGDYEAAIDNLLHILSVEKDWNEGAAREQLLKIFEALGPADPHVAKGRRRLSTLLFS